MGKLEPRHFRFPPGEEKSPLQVLAEAPMAAGTAALANTFKSTLHVLAHLYIRSCMENWEMNDRRLDLVKVIVVNGL